MGVIGVLSKQKHAFYAANCSPKHCILSSLQNAVESILYSSYAILYSIQKLSSLFTEENVDEVKSPGCLLWGSPGCILSRRMHSIQQTAV